LKAVEVFNLVKFYGKLKALDGISFDVNYGEIFALLGPNGAGKTTTLEILQGLKKATEGKAKVLGYSLDKKDLKDLLKRIGVLPQEFSCLDNLTVKENISFFAKLYDKHLNLEELLDFLDLKEKKDFLFKNLSGGLKRRVGLAISLVNDPELLFLDEPTTGLDPHIRREVWSLIKKLKERGKTTILTTHYMEEAESLADRIAIINQGKIIALGELKELLKIYKVENLEEVFLKALKEGKELKES